MSRLGGFLVAFLFGGAFAAVGVFMCAMAGSSIWVWAQSSTWESTPAEIKTLKLATSHGDSTTYRVEATYVYTYQGQPYRGDTPSLYNISDNIGSFNEDLYYRLRADKRAGRASCWVNPQDPSKSLLDRTFRPGFLAFQMVFMIAFGSVGFGVLSYVISARKPRLIDGQMHLHSGHRESRFACKVMMIYHGLIALMVVPPSMWCLFTGDLVALVPLTLVIGSIAIVYFAFRFVYITQPIAGKLRFPQANFNSAAHGHNSDTATLMLPSSWQGPVDLETRWTIPAPPTNQVGLEDEEGEASHVESPSVGGTTSVTEVKIPMPDFPEGLSPTQPIKLEIMGTIGGYPYHDEFEIEDEALRWLHGEK